MPSRTGGPIKVAGTDVVNKEIKLVKKNWTKNRVSPRRRKQTKP